jgi:hypothetical protein
MSTLSAPAPNVPPPLARTIAPPDFPTWLPAMLVKELRQGLRTRGFVGTFIGFQVVMVMLMIGTVFGSMLGTSTTRAIMASTITGFFWTLLGVQLLLSVPVRSLSSLQVELDSRALDLLVLTRLTAWRIVVGKWASLLAQALLLFIAMLPYGIVRYFLGSVDLVEDAMLGAAMIGGCAVLTAAGLACSGLPKIARIIVPIVMIMGFQVVRPLMMLIGGRGGSSGSPFGFGTGGEMWVWWLNGALVLGIFLVTAVRRIAPPAENYVMLTRGLALGLLLPVLPLGLLGKFATARGQLIFAAAMLAMVGAVELTSMRWPMFAHWRPWAHRGSFARGLGRLGLPGWPSAFVFMLFAGGLVGLVLLWPNLGGATEAARMRWLVVLAITGLIFPAVTLSFFRRANRSPAAFYGLLFGVASFVAAMAAAMANSVTEWKPLLSFAAVLPVSGFWITLFAPDQFSIGVVVGQAVVAAVILGLAWWRAKIYWAELARIDAGIRNPKP